MTFEDTPPEGADLEPPADAVPVRDEPVIEGEAVLDPATAQVIQQYIREEFSGPLPHPAILRQYNEVVPGAADRIITMAEGQAQHRQGLEKSTVDTENRNSTLGLIFAFVVALAVIAAGTYLLANDKNLAGFTTLLVGLGTLIGAFIYRERISNGA